jgi:hypothetical protein
VSTSTKTPSGSVAIGAVECGADRDAFNRPSSAFAPSIGYSLPTFAAAMKAR